MSTVRVALYSHDTVGLGHTRRNLSIAGTLAGRSATDLVMITGNPEAAALPRPPRTDVITMPTIAKDPRGSYRSRVLSLPYRELIRIRQAMLTAVITEYRPDLELRVDQGLADDAGPLIEAMLDGYAPDPGLAARLDGYHALAWRRLSCVYAFRPEPTEASLSVSRATARVIRRR